MKRDLDSTFETLRRWLANPVGAGWVKVIEPEKDGMTNRYLLLNGSGEPFSKIEAVGIRFPFSVSPPRKARGEIVYRHPGLTQNPPMSFFHESTGRHHACQEHLAGIQSPHPKAAPSGIVATPEAAIA